MNNELLTLLDVYRMYERGYNPFNCDSFDTFIDKNYATVMTWCGRKIAGYLHISSI